MRKLLLLSPLLLMSGCGITVTQSYLKAGIIMEDEVMVSDSGSRVMHEDFVGIKLQWLPYFSWTDVCNLFKSKKEKGAIEVTP